jgi:hypothetical protein
MQRNLTGVRCTIRASVEKQTARGKCLAQREVPRTLKSARPRSEDFIRGIQRAHRHQVYERPVQGPARTVRLPTVSLWPLETYEITHLVPGYLSVRRSRSLSKPAIACRRGERE